MTAPFEKPEKEMTDTKKPRGPENRTIDAVFARTANTIKKNHPDIAEEMNLENILRNAVEFLTVELVYNDKGTVQKIRIWDDGEFQNLEIGKVFINTEEGKKSNEVRVNGYVYDERYTNELAYATKFRKISTETYEQGNRMLKTYVENWNKLSDDEKQETVIIREWMLTPIIHSFLLTHPDSHPELARLYRDTIFSRLRQRSELRGHFNVPEKPTCEATIDQDGLPEFSELTISGLSVAEQRLNELNDKQSALPWRSWLPHKVQFLRDEYQKVYALQTVKNSKPVDIGLHRTIVRTKEIEKNTTETYEWMVYADKNRDADAARTTICLVQQSLDLVKVYPQSRLKDTEELTHHEFCVLGVVVACFLLVDPLCHAELGKLFHPNIIKHLKAMPDLRGQFQ